MVGCVPDGAIVFWNRGAERIFGHATSDALGMVLPSNSPGVHTLWLPVIPMQIGLALKPGQQEPWTPMRMAQALFKAGEKGYVKAPNTLAYDMKYVWQFEHEGKRRIVLATDRPMGFLELTRASRTTDYNVSLVVLELDPETGEGEGHAAAFLEGGEKSGSEIQEIFLKRCAKLLELYPASTELLDRLMQVYRARGMTLEACRAGCLKACVLFDAGSELQLYRTLRTASDTILEIPLGQAAALVAVSASAAPPSTLTV